MYAERFAAPGKLALGCAADLALAGALGMLSHAASRLECAAALAGAPHAMMPPEVDRVRFHGAPGVGVSGHDIALELERRLPARGADRVIEVCGPGVERLAMRDRFAIAAAAKGLGSRAIVFPSDEVTHDWMRALGRDADWKRSPAELEAAAMLELELEAVEPWLQRPGEPEAIRAVRHAAGTRVRRVIIGPRATYGDWAALAACLRGRGVNPRVACVVVPGSLRTLAAARAGGLWSELEASGIRLAAESGEAGVAPRPEGMVLQYGLDDAADEIGHDGAWHASLESCAAAALTGAITDPREIVAEGPAQLEPPSYPIDADRILAPSAGSGARAPNPRPTVPKRGVVLLRAGDDLSAARVLPLGPKLAALPPEELVELVFATIDRGFAARALAAGSGWLVAGRGVLGGPRADLVAWMLARLEVRVVIARGYAAGAATALVHAGVLPLVASERDDRGLETGDELEMPGGFEAIEPGIPVTVRDLTRGTQLLLTHPLGPHEVVVLKAGGLLAPAAVAA